MGFLNALGSLTKAAIDIVVTPIDAVKDAATLGGVLTGEEESYTGKRLRKAKENAENAYDKLDEDEV